MTRRLNTRYRRPRAFTIVELGLVLLLALNVVALIAALALGVLAALGTHETSVTGSLVGVVAMGTLTVTFLIGIVITVKDDIPATRLRVLATKALVVVGYASYLTTWCWFVWAAVFAASPLVVVAAGTYVAVHVLFFVTGKVTSAYPSDGQTFLVRG